MTKLTLTISDPDIIAEAKEYARKTERSLSSLVENYLKSLTSSQKTKKTDASQSPLVESILGIGGPAPSKTDKELLSEILQERNPL